MSENQEIETGDDSGKGLRAQLEKLAAENRELKSANEQLSKNANERQLADVLSAKQISPKAARFILADGVDPSDGEAVEKWLTDNSDLIGVSKAETPTTSVSQEDQDAFGRMQNPDFRSPALRSELQAFLAKAEELAAKGDVEALDKHYAASKF